MSGSRDSYEANTNTKLKLVANVADVLQIFAVNFTALALE